MPMILCCGEALIDMIPTETADGGTAYRPLNGGAIYNTAIALGRLGTPVGMLTGLSSDLFGQQLAAGLVASHVRTELVITSDRPTTLAFVELRAGHARYTFYDENSAGRMIRPVDLPPLPDGIGALYFGGISLACEPGAEAYAALLAREGGTRAVMIDPNIRPGFITDPVVYRARLAGMIALADIVKLSDEDLDWLHPGAGLAERVAAVRAGSAKIIIVTRGRDGAIAFLPGGNSVEVPAAPVEVVDTVGAGDTFNAGVLARLHEFGALGKPELARLTPDAIADALAFGAKVAAVTVSRAGANPPWRSELAPSP